MKRVVLVPRVSSDEQAKGYSLDIQERQLKDYCSKEGFEIVGIYREDHSAKNFNRPEFTKLLEYLKKNKGKVDLLLVTTWCRFSRNITESFAMMDRLKRYQVEVQAIEQPLDLSVPENLMMLAVYLAIPDIDNKRRSMKITTGVRAAKNEGRWLGKAPFGYKSILGEKNRKVIVPGDNAQIVKKAFSLILKGKAQSEVRIALKKEGFNFSSSTLSDLLRNRLYLGEVRVRKQEDEGYYYVKGLHEPLIHPEVFQKVQQILKGRRLDKGFVKAKSERIEFPLRGQLLCGHCAKPLTGSASKGRNGHHYYYHCNYCYEVRLRTKLVHQKIDSIFSEFRISKNATTLFNVMMSELLSKRDQKKLRSKPIIEREIKILQNRIKNIEDDYADRKITAESYTKNISRYETELSKLQNEISIEVEDGSAYKIFLRKGLSVVENLPEFFRKANPGLKKEILGSIFPEKLQIDEKKCRTVRINEALRLICATGKGLRHKKTGQLFKNLELSGDVEATGIEPVSKHDD
jgi:site-specific DNA recombinase